MKFSAKVDTGPVNKRLHFGGEWRSGSGIRIATLVRHALAEVCSVPVLLVSFFIQRTFSNVRQPTFLKFSHTM